MDVAYGAKRCYNAIANRCSLLEERNMTNIEILVKSIYESKNTDTLLEVLESCIKVGVDHNDECLEKAQLLVRDILSRLNPSIMD